MRAGNADDVRPLTDTVYARDAEIRRYRVKVLLHSYPGPGDNEVLSAASERVEDYVRDHFALGNDITLSGLHAALHVSGVQRVEITFLPKI